MNSVMKKRTLSIKDFFVPNIKGPKEVDWISGAFWIFFIITLWSAYPGVSIIPKPLEIVKAWIDVWENDALFWELVQSGWLFLVSTVITMVFSLVLAYSSRIGFFRPLVLGISKLRYFSLYGLTTIFTMMTFGAMSFNPMISAIIGCITTFCICTLSNGFKMVRINTSTIST